MTTQSAPAILVVDDEPLLAMELKMILADAGYEVVGPAPNARRALDLLASESIAGCLLDLNLGGSRSDAVADRLTESGIPFVFVSGHTSAQLSERHNGRPLLNKPIEEEELLAIVADLLR